MINEKKYYSSTHFVVRSYFKMNHLMSRVALQKKKKTKIQNLSNNDCYIDIICYYYYNNIKYIRLLTIQTWKNLQKT